MIEYLAMLGFVLLGQTMVNSVTYAILFHVGAKQLRSLQPLPNRLENEENRRLAEMVQILLVIFSFHLLLLYLLTHSNELRPPFQVVKDGIPRLTVKAAVVQLIERYNVALWIVASLLLISPVGFLELAARLLK